MAQSNEFTAVRVDYGVWDYLHQQKDPGQSMNDVLRGELNLDDSEDQPA